MRIIGKKRFKLPYLGKEKFKELTRIGLGYTAGSFFIKNFNNVERIKDALSAILDEDVSFIQTCFICEKAFLCNECKYRTACKSKDLPFFCICKECYQRDDLYELYVKKRIYETFGD